MKRPAILSALVVVAAAAAFSSVRLLADDAAKPPVAPPAASTPEIKPELVAKIHELFKACGVEASMRAVMDATIAQLGGNPNLPAGFFERFKEKAKTKDLLDLVVPVYAKHLDEPTIDALIAFYDTPAGRKLVAEQPAMVAETATAGAVWGRKLGEEIVRELREKK